MKCAPIFADMFNKMLSVAFVPLGLVAAAAAARVFGLTTSRAEAIKQAMKTPIAITGICIIG